jgi:hypothetical protein
MLERLKLEHVGPADAMELTFADRLNLLTGDNGLGKSFILDTAWWALSRTWPGEQAWPQPGHRSRAKISYTVRGKLKSSSQTATFDPRSWSWKRRQGRKPNPGLVIYARVDGGYGVWDPARNYWRDDPDVREHEAEGHVDSYLFSKETLWNGLEHNGTVLCNGLLRDWVSWQQKRGSREFKTLAGVLDVLSPGAGEPLKPGPPMRLSCPTPRSRSCTPRQERSGFSLWPTFWSGPGTSISGR